MKALVVDFAAVAVRDVALAALAGYVISVIAYGMTRLPKLSATTRHAVWIVTVVTVALLPFGAIGRSVAARHTVDDTTRLVAVVRPRAGINQRRIVSSFKHEARVDSSATTEPRLALSVIPTFPSWLPSVLLGVWAVGALVGLALLMQSLFRVAGLKRRSSPLSEQLSGELPWLVATDGREILLRLSDEIETPVAVGFRRPVILIPTEFADKQGLAKIEDLVQHEHAHLRRYDDWTNLAGRIVERLFWWNPIVYLIGARIALEREIAADDCVVASGAVPARYAESLWRLAREMRMPVHATVAPGAFFTRKQISIRIECLLDGGRNAVPRVSPSAAWAAIAFGVVGMCAVIGIAPALEINACSVLVAAIDTT